MRYAMMVGVLLCGVEGIDASDEHVEVIAERDVEHVRNQFAPAEIAQAPSHHGCDQLRRRDQPLVRGEPAAESDIRP